eukprot:tig00000241_g21025.t1
MPKPRRRSRSNTPERSGSEEPEEDRQQPPDDDEANEEEQEEEEEFAEPPVKASIEYDGPQTWEEVQEEEEYFEVPMENDALVLDDAEEQIEIDENTDPLTGRPISQLLAEAREEGDDEQEDEDGAPTSFEDLQEGLDRLRRIVTDQAQQLKSLLKQHFHNYVACKEAVENMQRELSELEGPNIFVQGNSESLQQAFNEVYKIACQIYDPIIQRKQFSDDARSALQLLRRINFALSLPGQLDEQFANHEYEGIVRTHQKAMSLLQDSKVPLLQKVLEEVQKKVDKIQQTFLDKMGDAATSEEEALRLASCVLVADAVSGKKSLSSVSAAEVKQQVTETISSVFQEYASLINRCIADTDSIEKDVVLAVQRACVTIVEGTNAKLLGKRMEIFTATVIQQFVLSMWASCNNDLVLVALNAAEGQLVEGFSSTIQATIERSRGIEYNPANAMLILKSFQDCSLAFFDTLHPQLMTSAAFQIASATSKLASAELKAQWDKLARCLSKEILASDPSYLQVVQEACGHLHDLAIDSIGRQLCKAITSKCHEGLRVPASSMSEDIRGFLVQILLGFVELRTKLEESFGPVIRLGMRHLLNTYAEIAYECERDSDLAESLNFEFRFLLAISAREEGRGSRSSSSESSQNWKHVLEKLRLSNSLSEDALKTCIQKHRMVLEALDLSKA